MTDSEEDSVDALLKLIFLGDASVGKTSIIRKFCYNDTCRQYNPTIGADFHVKRLYIKEKQNIKLEITDLGRNEINGGMAEHYLLNSDVVFLVYDITNCESFENLPMWLNVAKKVTNDKASIAIIGNKNDLEHKRAVRLDKTQEFVNKFGVLIYLVSAKTGENINFCVAESITKKTGFHIPNDQELSKIRSTQPRQKVAPQKFIENRRRTPQSDSSVCCIS